MTEQATTPSETTGQTAAATTAASPAETAAKPAETAATGATPAAETKPAVEGAKPAADPAKEAEAKPGEKPADKAAAATPPDYSTLTLPEGFAADEKLFGDAKGIFAELNVPPEQAQKLVTLASELAAKAQASVGEAWTRQIEDWGKELAADKEIGGDKLDATKTAASKAIDHVGRPGLRKILAETGLGNHPDIVHAFARFGREFLTEGTLVTGNRSAPANPLRARYPNSDFMFGGS